MYDAKNSNGPNGDTALVTSFTSCTSCYLLFLRIPKNNAAKQGNVGLQILFFSRTSVLARRHQYGTQIWLPVSSSP